MANSVVQIGDKYYKKQYGDTMIKDISIVSQCVEGLGDYLKNYNCIKDALVEYFNEKNIDSEKINNMSDELSSMIINIISMSLKLSFEPISKTLEISKEEADEIIRINKVRMEAHRYRDRFKDCTKVQCNKCKQFIKFEESELDHIVPVNEGGTSDTSNLQFLCHKCHMEKHHSVKEEQI